ncbi:MAG TPA: SDR family NAD(P)-dependent oxidoreductase, partial [Hyphomicrobiaceae bacterium]|nr:SDR family NAD(P)-dependent oxidoreductase [Hyphomicrobiaceae bacterium]
MSKIILVTGGARGIGAATARLAAARGYDVAINYASRPDAAEAVARDVSAAGRRAAIFRADVASEAQVKAMFSGIDRELGRIDVLVNNAGILHPMSRFEETPEGQFEAMFAVNVFGVVYATREAIRRMAPRHGGKGGVIV